METNQNLSNTAIRVNASAFGILAGLTGIIAGYFEIQQGDVIPQGLWISSIGPGYRMWEDSAYAAITVLPSFYLTGILAIFISLTALIWSTLFIHRRYGAPVMLILALAQCLVGGGWVLDLGIFTSVFGSRINHPLNWWRKHLPMNVRPILVSLWPWSVLGYSLLSLLLLIATVMGVNNASIVKYTLSIATAMIIPIPIMILGAIAHDIQ